MKKLTALTIVLVLVIAMVIPVYADENPNERGSSIPGGITVWLCASENLNTIHSWLIIYNNTSLQFYIGDYLVLPGAYFTIGGWRTVGSSGAVYINKETTIAYADAIAVSYTIEPYDFDALADAIEDASSKFYYVDDWLNCVYAYTCNNFALEVWYEIGGPYMGLDTTSFDSSELYAQIYYRSHISPNMPGYTNPTRLFF